MAYLELILLVSAIVALIVLAQRSRLKTKDYAALQAVADRRGLVVERGEGTAAVVGAVDGRSVRVHAIMDGWAVTIGGVTDENAARAALPDAAIGAGRLQLPTTLDADAIDAAIERGLDALAKEKATSD